ncbi:MAG: S-layer homology domain-containing protein [Candidatus Peribacteria bacterium]|jgi:hypothetical protein|nr:S-layer homology domain-containing protein [Candidatus Peribacteria bacterium]
MKEIDDCPDGDYSPSYYDDICNSEDDHASAEENEDSSQAQNDQQDLYDWAKEHKLTDTTSKEEMRLQDNITRAEIAKVIVSYINSLDSSQAQNDTDNNDKCSSFTDLNQVNAELQSYIIKACEYGLMGYYADGETTKEKFFPNGDITRAEVVTIISRMLRGNTYKGTEEERYQKHLLALKKENIIQTDRNPMEVELREYVFLMLYRVA